MKYLIALLFILSACSHKVVPISDTHQIDTVIVKKTDTIRIEPTDDVFYTDFQSICDSLAKGIKPIIHVVKKDAKHKASLTLNTVNNTVECETDSLLDVISTNDLIIHDKETIIKEDQTQIDSLTKSNSLFKGIAIGFGIVLILLLGFIYLFKVK